MEQNWTYETRGNGAFVAISGPDGQGAFLQGDDAAEFCRKIEATNDRYTDADVCREYAERD